MITDEMKQLYDDMMRWTGVAHDAHSSDIAAYRAANARAEYLIQRKQRVNSPYASLYSN